MASYKVIQDIEAEDHILGPFSFRQFAYLLIAITFAYFSFLSLTKGASFLLILFLPPVLFFGFMALPLNKNQPTEVWTLAVLRFLFKPRKRIWDQSGLKELVVITAPKKIEQQLTKNFDHQEIKSRLKFLSQTMDTRGWSLANYNPLQNNGASDDRLINDIGHTFKDQNIDVYANQLDILDDQNNPIADQISNIINQKERTNKERLMKIISSGEEPQVPLETNLEKNKEAELSSAIKSQLQQKKSSISHLHEVQDVLSPSNHDQTAVPPADDQITSKEESKPSVMTPQPNPVIMNLSQRDGLNLETISKEAKKLIDQQDDEVVISLH